MWVRYCRLGNFQTYRGGELGWSTPTMKPTSMSSRRWENSLFVLSVNTRSFPQGGCNHWQVGEYGVYRDPRIHRLLSEAYWHARPYHELCQPKALWWCLLPPLCSVSTIALLLYIPLKVLKDRFRYKKWESDRILSFVPPDGNFRLVSYHIGSGSVVSEDKCCILCASVILLCAGSNPSLCEALPLLAGRHPGKIWHHCRTQTNHGSDSGEGIFELKTVQWFLILEKKTRWRLRSRCTSRCSTAAWRPPRANTVLTQWVKPFSQDQLFESSNHKCVRWASCSPGMWARSTPPSCQIFGVQSTSLLGPPLNLPTPVSGEYY